MCGIVGMAGDLGFKDRDVLKDMLDVSQLRGRHSTGVVKVDRDMNYTWVKRVGPPAYLFDSREYDNTINTGTAAAYIGHTRHKTVGEVNIANAHPFDIEEHGIVGVHNGTLRQYRDLDGHDLKKVDSQVLFEHLAANGPEDTFPKIEGAWACVWWDDESETLNFIRNKERPLWFTWSKDLRKLYWASEIWMLASVERKIDLWDGIEGQSKWIDLPVDTLWSFRVNPKATGKEKVINMRPQKSIKGKEYVAVNRGSTYAGNTAWRRNENKGHSSGSSAAGSDPEAWKVNSKNWEKNERGVWVFVGERGSATSPFALNRDKLDDPLPKHLLAPPEKTTDSPVGKKPTLSIVGSSSTNLKNGSDASTPSKSTQSSSESTTSPVPRNSVIDPRTSKNDLSVVSQDRRMTTMGSPSRRTGVSLRQVVGQEYITNNRTGIEYSIAQFEKNTKGICSHCKEPIGGLSEVVEMFDKDRFLCQACVVTPSEEKLRKVV